MKFDKALELMKQGFRVKLPSWGGYWCWDDEKQTIMMHCREKDSDTGKSVLDIRETQRVEYTLSNILSEEWAIADEQNTPILGGNNYFSFSEALKYLKRGFKVIREGWNDKNSYLILMDFGDTADTRICIKTEYRTFVPWSPSQIDLLSNDWMFYED